jgi:hypothetical protein
VSKAIVYLLAILGITSVYALIFSHIAQLYATVFFPQAIVNRWIQAHKERMSKQVKGKWRILKQFAAGRGIKKERGVPSRHIPFLTKYKPV